MANQGGRDLERMIIQEKLASSPFLAGASLPLEQVTSKRFRAGQIISDKPSGVSSVGMTCPDGWRSIPWHWMERMCSSMP